ncbi:MAG: response regulator [Aquabacterium sp.]|uniref:response regulator n=1 Tax=Aquabacterium sp. TaxID=1872578 RepID=UPI0025BB8D5C|nr:response regulator [Aquabacterium sp.]MBI3382258.1 response regulator [Aquabacterium sp.]
MSRLLLVDDEPNVVAALQRVMRRRLARAVQVEAFDNPLAALARIQTMPFDVVLSDFRMPQMDGFTFLKLVREKWPHCVRMVLSASTEVDALMKAVNDVEVFRYLSKPWQEDELISQIQLALAHSAASREERALADDRRAQIGEMSPQALELKRLEEMEPGITQVNWGPNGEILMPPLDP